MSPRKEFTKKTQAQIIMRATRGDVPYCEECGSQATRFQIDHTVADALIVEKRALTAEDGRLLCIPCHTEKTRDDVCKIAKAVRLEQNRLGVKKQASHPIQSAGFAPVDKSTKASRLRIPEKLTGIGPSNLARRFLEKQP
jgi:5-methylcytosine-specific restriction protein A